MKLRAQRPGRAGPAQLLLAGFLLLWVAGGTLVAQSVPVITALSINSAPAGASLTMDLLSFGT